MALVGIAPPGRLRGLPESSQRQFDQWYEWLLRLSVAIGGAGLIEPVFLFGAGPHVIVPEHVNKILVVSHTAAATVTLGAAITRMKMGSVIYITQAHASGQVTVAAESGVTINSSESKKTRKQWAVLGLLKTGNAEALLHGDRELA